MQYVLLATAKVASGVRQLGGVRRLHTAFVGARAVAEGNAGLKDGIRLLPYVPDKDIQAMLRMADNVPCLISELSDLPYTGSYYDITPWLNRHGLKALYKQIDEWSQAHPGVAEALTFVCIAVPAEFLKIGVSPWVAPTSTLKTLSTQIMGPIETLEAYRSHGQWSSRLPRVRKIQSVLTSIVEDTNRLMASSAAYLNQKNTVLSALEKRRLDHFLSHPPAISTQLARAPMMRPLLKEAGSSIRLVQTGLDAMQGATLPQRLSRTAESIRLLQDTRLLHALLPESLDSIAEGSLSFAKNLHQTWWLRGPALGLALTDVALNAFEMQRNFSQTRDVLRHPLQTARDVIASYFAGAPWPSESLAQRQNIYQVMKNALLGVGDAPSSFERMMQNLSFNLAVHAGREAGTQLGKAMVRPLYWLYALWNEHNAYGYYPDFVQRLPFWEERIPRATADMCLHQGLVFSDPVADSALFYFLNRFILEKVVTQWGGALASGVGAGLSRNLAMQVVNTPGFVRQLRETLNDVLTNFLFNPEELLACEDLNPLAGVTPRGIPSVPVSPETLQAVTRLVDTGLSWGATQLSERLGKSSLSPLDLPWPETTMEYLRRPLQLVPHTQSYAIDQWTRQRTRSKVSVPAAPRTAMEGVLAKVDKALESTALATHAKVEPSLSERAMWPVIQSISYASTYFTSKESTLRKRIAEASTLEQLPSLEELNFLDKQAKNSLSGLYTKWDAAQKIRRERAAKECFLRDESALLIRVQRAVKSLFQTYRMLSHQIERAPFESSLPQDSRLQDVLGQFYELVHRETQVAMSRQAMRYINLLKSVIDNDLVVKKQQKLAELKQSECLVLLDQFAAFIKDNRGLDDKNSLIQVMIEGCYATDPFQAKFPTIGPFLVESLRQLLPMEADAFANQWRLLKHAMQSLVESSNRMNECGQMLATSVDSNRFITGLENEKATLRIPNTEVPDGELQKVMRQALETQYEYLIAQAKAWHADVAYAEPKLEALELWLNADNESSFLDVEANRKQLEEVFLRAQSNNTGLYFLINQRIAPQSEPSSENIRRVFEDRIRQKLQRNLVASGNLFREAFQKDILALRQAGTLCLQDITSRAATYVQKMDAYVGSFKPPLHELMRGWCTHEKAQSEAVFALAHQQYDACKEVRKSLQPLVEWINTMKKADALPDAPRELGAWKNRLLPLTQSERESMQGLLDHLWHYHARECLQVLQEAPFSIQVGGEDPRVLIQERIIRSINENLERIFRGTTALQIQSLLNPPRRFGFFAAKPITAEQRQREMTALQNAVGLLPLEGGQADGIRQGLRNYIEQQFPGKTSAERPSSIERAHLGAVSSS